MMNNFTQTLIDGCNTKTEDGFAEALMIAIRSLENKGGLLIGVRLSDDPKEEGEFARQIARMMLHKREWKHLTNEDIDLILGSFSFAKPKDFAKIVDFKLKEKNA